MGESGTIKIAQVGEGTGLQMATLPQKWSEGILKTIYVRVHTHTQSHANLFIFGLCKETPSNPQGWCHLHDLPLNAQALTGPLAGLSVVQTLTLAVKLPQLSGRQDLPRHIRWFFHQGWYFSLASSKYSMSQRKVDNPIRLIRCRNRRTYQTDAAIWLPF